MLKLYTESETLLQEEMMKIFIANGIMMGGGGLPGMAPHGERRERPEGAEQGERPKQPEGMGQGEGGQRPPMMMDPAVIIAIQAQMAEAREAQEAKNEKKLKKILKADQFEEWTASRNKE